MQRTINSVLVATEKNGLILAGEAGFFCSITRICHEFTETVGFDRQTYKVGFKIFIHSNPVVENLGELKNRERFSALVKLY